VARVWFALLLCLAATAARAQEFSGYAEVKGFLFAERESSRDPWAIGWATLFAKAEDRIGPAQCAASLRAEDRSDDDGEVAFDPADRKIGRSPLSVREFWTRFPLTPALDLQAGRFELGWGKTDGYSPADAFLPRDLTDPFSDEKLPLWAARLSGQWDWFRLEAVACPLTTPWRLPALGGRYAPFDLQNFDIEEKENAPPRAGFGALRLLAAAGDWDLGAWGRFGVRPAPLLEAGLDPASPDPLHPVVTVRRRYAREEAAGLEVSRVLYSFVLRAEGAFLHSDDRDLGDALIWALSAERGWGDGTLIVTLADNAKETPVDAALLFDRALLPAFIAAWNQAAPWGNWKIAWTAGLAHGDGLAKAEVGYDLDDFWKFTLAGQLPYGDKDGPLGALHAARNVQAALRRSW
jgi:hypothetical protein